MTRHRWHPIHTSTQTHVFVLKKKRTTRTSNHHQHTSSTCVCVGKSTPHVKPPPNAPPRLALACCKIRTTSTLNHHQRTFSTCICVAKSIPPARKTTTTNAPNGLAFVLQNPQGSRVIYRSNKRTAHRKYSTSQGTETADWKKALLLHVVVRVYTIYSLYMNTL